MSQPVNFLLNHIQDVHAGEMARRRAELQRDEPDLVGRVTNGRRLAFVDINGELFTQFAEATLTAGATYDTPNTTAHGRDTAILVSFV